MLAPRSQQPIVPVYPHSISARIRRGLSRFWTLHQIRRARSRRILGGVCRGFANHLHLPVSLFRLVFLAAALLGTTGVWIYLALWVFIPRETKSDRKHRVLDTVPVFRTGPIATNHPASQVTLDAAKNPLESARPPSI